MLKCFPIDFVRQILEQKLEEEHLKNVNFYGGKKQVSLLSFYEQLKTQEDVSRFVETYRDLTEQENRMDLILNGVLVSPENPTITNLYSSLVVPMSFTCSFRCNVGNRDDCIITLNNLIEKLKGRKIDVAQLNCVDENGIPYATPFCVGTMCQSDNTLTLKDGDYFGTVNSVADKNAIITDLSSKGITLDISKDYYLYCTNDDKLKVMRLYFYGAQSTWAYTIVSDDGSIDRIVFPPTHTSFEKYKVSISFDAIRCDEPRNLNGNEYCQLSFGGSATLVNKTLQLGNDLLKVKVSKDKIVAATNITYSSNFEFLEPLELPSGNNVNTQINQLVSNNFKTNSHADSIAIALQYTFMIDFSSDLIKKWFNYARYGTHDTSSTGVSPNTIYDISEIWCSWGELDVNTFKAKIIENIDIENTESDTLTISLTFQVQGDYN